MIDRCRCLPSVPCDTKEEMTEFHIVIIRTCTACGLIRDRVPLARKREAERDEQDEDPGPRGPAGGST